MTRKNISTDVKRQARQRAKFTCQVGHTNQLTFNQYAHKIPYADGRDNSIDNILWLCYDCHKKYEPQGKKGARKLALIKKLEEVRDRRKNDGLVGGVFDELLAQANRPIIVQAGPLSFTKYRKIFSERYDAYKPSFLSFYYKDGHIVLDGHIKDENGFTLVRFNDSYLRFDTRDVWDVERSQGCFKIYNKDRSVWLDIKQDDDLRIIVTGRIFLGGRECEINKERFGDKKGVSFNGGGTLSGNDITNSEKSGKAAILIDRPVPVPRPIGHVSPNYDL